MRLVKDAAAAGVLVTAVAAALIGEVIFLPRALAAAKKGSEEVWRPGAAPWL